MILRNALPSGADVHLAPGRLPDGGPIIRTQGHEWYAADLADLEGPLALDLGNTRHLSLAASMTLRGIAVLALALYPEGDI